MTKSVFVATTEPYSGKSIVALGLVNMLLGKTKKIGYFKPVINIEQGDGKDAHIQTITEYFNLGIKYEDTYAFTRSGLMRQMENSNQDRILHTIIHKFKELEEDYDFTVIEGSDFLGEGTAFEFELNLSIAKNLNTPVIIVSSGENKTTAEIVSAVMNAFRNFQSREVQVIAIVVNKVRPEQSEDVHQLLAYQLTEGIILAIIPLNKALLSPSMKEIHEVLGGNLLFGEEHLSNQVDNVVIGAMHVPHFLNHIKENVLIITPGDRGDMIIAALQANLSVSYPKVSGIILTA
ncbi:MAG TPA: AAA family ATPase, partial [Segetibacter sp.]|nr:AAA family ATPase [Segetibacter sp.]